MLVYTEYITVCVVCNVMYVFVCPSGLSDPVNCCLPAALGSCD